MLGGRRVGSRKREQGKLWAAPWRGESQWGVRSGHNLQEGRRLALGLLGRNVPEMGTLVDKVEEGAELEVRGATGVDHTVSWADCDKGPCTS